MNNKCYTYTQKGWVYFENDVPIIEQDKQIIELLNFKFNK